MTPPKTRNGAHKLATAGVIMAFLGMLSGFTLYMFKTNRAADLEHMQLQNAHDRDQEIDRLLLKQHAETQQMLIEEVARNGRNVIKIGEKLNAQGLEDPRHPPRTRPRR